MREQLIEVLPPAPKDLLREQPRLARGIFSAERLPVSCPLPAHSILLARAKINMRGAGASLGGSLMRNSLRVVAAECGYNRAHASRVYARTSATRIIAQCMSVYVYIRIFSAHGSTRVGWQLRRQGSTQWVLVPPIFAQLIIYSLIHSVRQRSPLVLLSMSARSHHKDLVV